MEQSLLEACSRSAGPEILRQLLNLGVGVAQSV
jgi:hypothetical protein